MTTLMIKSVRLNRQAAGPDEVVLVVQAAKGGEFDLIEQRPRGEGEAFIASLGVAKYHHFEATSELKPNTRRRLVIDEERTI